MTDFFAHRSRTLVAVCLATLLFAGCGPDVSTSIPTSTPAEVAVVPTTTIDEPTATSALPTEEATPSPLAADTPEAAALPTGEAATPQPSATALAPVNTTWSRVGLAGTVISDLALLAGDTNLVLASAPAGVWRASYPYTEWEELGVPSVKKGEAQEGQSVEVSIASPDVLYASNHGGCATGLPVTASFSLDGGEAWQQITDAPGSEAMVIAPATQEIAYATICSGIIKTVNSGATWEDLPASKIENFDPIRLATSPDGETVYAAYASEGGSGMVRQSTDAGATWTDVTPKNTPTGEFRAPGNLHYVPGSVGRPQDGGLYMTSDEGLWFLPSETTDWEMIDLKTGEEGYSWFSALFVDTTYTEEYAKDGPVIYAAKAKPGEGVSTGLGIFRSTDLGKTWQNIGAELGGLYVTRIILAPHDPAALPGMLETLLVGTNDGVWALPMLPLADLMPY